MFCGFKKSGVLYMQWQHFLRFIFNQKLSMTTIFSQSVSNQNIMTHATLKASTVFVYAVKTIVCESIRRSNYHKSNLFNRTKPLNSIEPDITTRNCWRVFQILNHCLPKLRHRISREIIPKREGAPKDPFSL